MKNKIQTLTKKIDAVSTQSKDMDKKIEGKLNYMGTKIDVVSTQSKDNYRKIDAVSTQNKDMQTKIDAFVVPYGWKYLGRGTRGTRSDAAEKTPATFTECVNFCEKKRADHGASWNGIVYTPSIQQCYCFSNDRGHNMNYPEGVHLRFE